MKEIEGFGFYLGVLLVSLVALYGISSLLIKFAPAPVNGWIGTIVKKSTPSGWAIAS